MDQAWDRAAEARLWTSVDAVPTEPRLKLAGRAHPFGGADTAVTLTAYLPRAALELLPGAGHPPWLDDLRRCVDLTNGFLAT